MSLSRDALKTVFLANVLADKQAVLCPDPFLSHMEEEAEMLSHSFPAMYSDDEATFKHPDSQLPAWNASELLFQTIQMLLTTPPADTDTINTIANSLAAELAQARPTLDFANHHAVLKQLAIAALGSITSLFSWEHSTVPNYCSVNCGPALTVTRLHMANCDRSVRMFVSLFGLIPQARATASREPSLPVQAKFSLSGLCRSSQGGVGSPLESATCA